MQKWRDCWYRKTGSCPDSYSEIPNLQQRGRKLSKKRWYPRERNKRFNCIVQVETNLASTKAHKKVYGPNCAWRDRLSNRPDVIHFLADKRVRWGLCLSSWNREPAWWEGIQGEERSHWRRDQERG